MTATTITESGPAAQAAPSGFLIVALAIAQHPELTPGAKLVYGALRYAAGRSTEHCRVSLATLCRYTGLADRSVRKALVLLYSRKLIEVDRENGRASGYRLLGGDAQPAAGFLVIPLPVSQSSELTCGAKLAYGALRRAAGRGGDKCSPTGRWIAEQSRLCRRTVLSAIGALAKAKVLEVARQAGQASSYRLLVVENQPKPARSEQPQPAATAAAAGEQPQRRLTRRDRVEREALELLNQIRPPPAPP